MLLNYSNSVKLPGHTYGPFVAYECVAVHQLKNEELEMFSARPHYMSVHFLYELRYLRHTVFLNLGHQLCLFCGEIAGRAG